MRGGGSGTMVRKGERAADDVFRGGSNSGGGAWGAADERGVCARQSAQHVQSRRHGLQCVFVCSVVCVVCVCRVPRLEAAIISLIILCRRGRLYGAEVFLNEHLLLLKNYNNHCCVALCSRLHTSEESNAGAEPCIFV